MDDKQKSWKMFTSYKELLEDPDAAMVGDIKMPPNLVTKAEIDESLAMKVEDGDIFVTSYPKSGTTWLQAVVWNILNASELETTDRIADLFTLKRQDQRFIDLNGIKGIENLPRPRVLVSHLPWNVVPRSSKAKYLHIIRDPKDTVISYFFMLKGIYKYPESDISYCIDQFIKGNQIYGDYFKVVKSWWEHRDDPNVLVLFYEQMLKDPRGHFLKIAEFLSKDAPQNYHQILSSEPSLLDKAVQNTSFNKMKEDDSKKPKEGALQLVNFFRKGVIGDHVNYMTKEQIAAANKRIREELGEPFTSIFRV